MKNSIFMGFPAFLLIVLGSFHVHAAAIPLITEAQKQESVKTIMDFGEEIKATISQQGRLVSLAITVDEGILDSDAKSLARSFVRAVKIFSPDLYQDEEALGTGIYDYRVTVRNPGGKELVSGVKMADQSEMEWTFPPTGKGD